MQLQLEQFAGPFDLLLSLISEKKLNITELALSAVTEQYLKYLDTLEENRAAELADFLVIAARLLLLKSQMLLPQFAAEAEDGPSLEEQLRLYKSFLDASKKINQRWLSGERAVFRIEPPRRPAGFIPPDNFTLMALHESMRMLVKRLVLPKALPEAFIDKTISLKEKIDTLRSLLKRQKRVNFFSTIADAKNKTEVIVGFLALLELVKQAEVRLSQGKMFQDILIARI